jgi:hypothetical protein
LIELVTIMIKGRMIKVLSENKGNGGDIFSVPYQRKALRSTTFMGNLREKWRGMKRRTVV